MNHIVLIGRLTRDPELRYTPNGVPVANFDLAVNRDYKQEGQPEVDFIRVVCWQKTAENAANYLSKGRLVGVEGRLQIRSYETQDGKKGKVAEVIANRVEFLEKANREGGQAPPVSSNGDETGGINLEDLPF